MKIDATSRNAPNTTPTSRRGLVVGAGVAGAAVVTARVLIPGEPSAVPAPANVKPVVAGAAGYQLTQHVLRYYETTRT